MIQEWRDTQVKIIEVRGTTYCSVLILFIRSMEEAEVMSCRSHDPYRIPQFPKIDPCGNSPILLSSTPFCTIFINDFL